MVHPLTVNLAMTTAICESRYGWMNNSKTQSPCEVLAYAQAACSTENINIPPIQPDKQLYYLTPFLESANKCVCSWAAYNLLDACMVCQGSGFVYPWDVYRHNCTGLESTLTASFWPMDVNFSTDSAIPFWAGHNPSTWPLSTFDTDTAFNLTNQHNPDILNPAPPPHHTAPIGAIVGPVVGGLAAIVIVITFLVRAIMKRRVKRIRAATQAANGHHRMTPNNPPVSPYLQRPEHERSRSDLTKNTYLSEVSSQPLSNGHNPGLPTPSPPPTTPLPHAVERRQQPFRVPELRPEEIIVPYNVAPPPTRPSLQEQHARKLSDNTSEPDIGVEAYSATAHSLPQYSERPDGVPVFGQPSTQLKHKRVKGSREGVGSADNTNSAIPLAPVRLPSPTSDRPDSEFAAIAQVRPGLDRRTSEGIL